MAKSSSFSRFDRHGESGLSQVVTKSQGLATKANGRLKIKPYGILTSSLFSTDVLYADHCVRNSRLIEPTAMSTRLYRSTRACLIFAPSNAEHSLCVERGIPSGSRASALTRSRVYFYPRAASSTPLFAFLCLFLAG